MLVVSTTQKLAVKGGSPATVMPASRRERTALSDSCAFGAVHYGSAMTNSLPPLTAP